MTEIHFNPDSAPDQALKDEGLCEFEACELTKEWIGGCFEAGEAGKDE